MAFDEPLVVVEIAEFLQRLFEVLDVGEGVDPEKLLLEGAPEAFDAPVTLRGSDEGGAGVHAQEAQIVLEGPGDELAAIVVTKL